MASVTLPIWLTLRSKPSEWVGQGVRVSQRVRIFKQHHGAPRTVASLGLNGLLDTLNVGDGQVVADDLDVGVGGEVAPGLPVVLVEGVLDGDDAVLLDVAEVDLGKLLAGDPLGGVGVGVLELQVVLAAVR